MKKILAVDDNPVMLKFLTKLLEKKGYQVLSAENGLAALDILKTYTPDIIFSDLIMPNIGGEKLCQVIRSMPNLKNVYLIILSAIVVEEEIDVTKFGADLCIAKGPFNKMADNILRVLNQMDQTMPGDLPVGIIGREDVYERIVTKELLSSKKHFEIILGNMSEGILELTHETKIVYANHAATVLTGNSEEFLLGTNFLDLFKDDNNMRIKSLLDTIDDSPKTISHNSPIILNNKQISLNILPFNTGEHQHIIVILDDITERKRMEDQLQQARKMEAIGTLSGGIAHDFNNLLMGIQGNISVMLLDVDTGHDHFEYLKRIEKIVKSGSKLSEQILGYARKGKYEVKTVLLNHIVNETSEIFARTRKEITLQLSLSEDLYPVEADSGQIEQALLNLYVNAWQAMPGGGDLFLKTANCTDKDIKGKLYNPIKGNYVKLMITDSGVGMSKKVQTQIFDPFFTTKEMSRGTGMGLASVYGIIKNHGGYIEVDSKKGKGTTFTIFLPASEKKFSKEKNLRKELLTGKGTILLVDDEDMIIETGEQILKILGYKVLVARSGKEALNIYKQHKDNIDMIILDMIMPNMGGGETFNRIKKINPGVKVLLSSGYSIEGEADKILKQGCNGFLQKPFNIIELSQKIREIIDNDTATSA